MYSVSHYLRISTLNLQGKKVEFSEIHAENLNLQYGDYGTDCSFNGDFFLHSIDSNCGLEHSNSLFVYSNCVGLLYTKQP